MNLIPLLTLLTVTLHVQVRTTQTVSHKHREAIGLVTCTAVYVSPNEVLTAAHCMEDNTGRMWVQNSDTKSFSATAERIDKVNDLALLRVEAPPHRYVKVGRPIKKGEKIYLISSEEDIPYTYGEGVVSNITIDPENNSVVILHTAAILHGASGSGLFDTAGKLVGINTATIKNLTMAVDVTVINGFLTNNYRT